MPEWHTRCNDLACHWRCHRTGCLEPDIHFLSKAETKTSLAYHRYDCVTPVSLAVEVVEALRPGMAPDEIAIARRVLLEALAKLEAQPKRPEIYRETA